MIHKLHEACYESKCVFHTGNTETQKTICFAYFYCVMKYTLIMWGFSSHSKKDIDSTIEMIKIISGTKPINSFRNLFQEQRLYFFHVINIFFN
jgi:hypothetical protein